ncbi:hypothetical protein BD410DRAFT_783200 [Rickenella mellea]|uniref:F-box domain-containing protein n=1 Tax=Rickenella mellea TaxID=50990 RepID=A0A4Y7QHB2_9AGAM|nr:hypothetical protein BD410DRAFT_783200 [Rickenella mellea]
MSVAGAIKSDGSSARVTVLPTLPLNILFEILGYLRPVGLLQVARVSKALRKILLSRSSKSVWSTARENMPGLPATPEDMSDAQWAHLIFETDCHAPGCEETEIREIEWALRIRACDECLDENALCPSGFAERFPDLQPEITQLLPYTHTDALAYGHDSTCRFYWTPTVLAMSKTVGEYQKNVALGKPGAKIGLNEFMEAQKVQAEEIMEYASLCQTWASSAVEKRRQALKALSDERIKAIRVRFEALGWNPNHLERLQWNPIACKSKKLTERAWIHIRPRLEKILQSDRVNRRVKQIEELAKEYKKTCTALQRAVFPDFGDLAATASLQAIATAKGFDDLTAQELEHYRLQLPVIATQALDKTKKRLLAKLPPIVNESGEIAQVSRVELAASALVCSSCHSYTSHHGHGKILFWPEICSHLCRASIPHSYDPNVAAIIQSVVRAVQLLPEVATGPQLDAHNARVLCMSCSPVKTKKRIGRNAYTWRGAITHCMTEHKNGETTSWQLLGQGDTEKIKQREHAATRDSTRRIPKWACNHCAWGYPDSQPTETATKQHVKEIHDIPAPALCIDVLQDRRTLYEPIVMAHGELREEKPKQQPKQKPKQDGQTWKCVTVRAKAGCLY